MKKQTDREKIHRMKELIHEAKHIVFLGGAGVSTESGIPDFRSANGLYHQKGKKQPFRKPEYMLSYDCLHQKAGSKKVFEIHGSTLLNYGRN